jgi:DNA-binding CsgD family transcriptional regulator/tetratricopeptide (TPR) repeat protein
VGHLPDDRVAERMQMLLWLAAAHFFTGDFASARRLAERGLRVARATGQGLYAPTFVCLRGWFDAERGQLDPAEADLDEALEAAQLSGNVQLAYWSHIALSQIAVHRGRTGDALAHSQAAWDVLGVIEYSQVAYAAPDARLAAGDVKGALAVLETFGWVNPGLWTLDRLKAIDVSVRVLLALGRVDEAEAWARRAPAEAGGRRTGVSGAVIALVQARVRLARGAPEDTARLAREGAAAGDEGDAPIWAARCRTLAGEALVAAGHAEEARAELRRAAADLDARGAAGRRDEALRLLRRLGERPRGGAHAGVGAGPLAGLTPREREVALLVADGCTNAQIAARLQLSESTVEKHVSRLLAKLGTSTRTGVVRLLAAASA